MVIIAPLVGPSAFGVVSVWFPHCFCMVLIVPLVGPSASGVVFVWFSHRFVRFSYGLNRPPSLVYRFSDRFRMVSLGL